MIRTRRPTRAAWIALLAMAALVFGPTLSRAIAATALAAPTHAHCEGMAAGEPAEPASGQDPFESCALCAVAALPVVQSVPVRLDGGPAPAARDTATPATETVERRPVRSPCSPRGPPTSG